MSCTTLHLVKSGGLEEHAEFHNAWRGAMFIWDTMARRYLESDSAFRFILLDEDAHKLWRLGTDPAVSQTDRIVLVSTFDSAMVKRDDLLDLADRFEAFATEHADDEHPSSLFEQAAELRAIINDGIECVGVCWTQTSVADHVWQIFDGEGECRWYDIDRDEDHFFIYQDDEVMNGRTVDDEVTADDEAKGAS